MRGISYENRFLVMVLSSVINGKKVAVPRKGISWRELLRLAEFHRVVSPVYYGTLGVEKTLSAADEETFYSKYHKEVLLEESYKNALEVILWQMNRHQVQGVLLRGVEIRSMYPKSEMGYTFSLEFLVSPKDMGKVYNIMNSMDYEQQVNRTNHGRLYFRVPGIRVIFYDEIPLGNEILYKHLTHAAQKYFHGNRKAGDKELESLHAVFVSVWQMGRRLYDGGTEDKGCHGLLLLHTESGNNQREKVYRRIAGKGGLTEFAKQLNILASLWFGQGGEVDTGTVFQLEEYIFSKGMEDRRFDSKNHSL